MVHQQDQKQPVNETSIEQGQPTPTEAPGVEMPRFLNGSSLPGGMRWNDLGLYVAAPSSEGSQKSLWETIKSLFVGK